MAAVVKAKVKSKNILPSDGDKSEENKEPSGESKLTTPLLSKTEEKSDSVVIDVDKCQNKQVNESKPTALQQNDMTVKVVARLSEDTEDGEVIGIITLEDVFEELLQGALNRQGQHPTGILKKPTEADLHTPRHQVNLVEPISGTKR
ncbi:hypothetical protein B296_00034205 [Ensete ventricosum]|uniref:CBS domain-containing protein n=1 Tax=Ensete ventricosum TaxID=4639 RepID=A0A426YFT5_ENSVE|nr:hypothetical protein B296_00034205 [Ensete ventricosum]